MKDRKKTEKRRLLDKLISKESAFDGEGLKRLLADLYPEAKIGDKAIEFIHEASKGQREELQPLDEMDVIEHTELVLDGTVTMRDVAQMELRFKHTFGIGSKGNNRQEY
jgi:hypothetical protein